MLSQSRKAAILQKLAGWVNDPTPGQLKSDADRAAGGPGLGFAAGGGPSAPPPPKVNAAGLGGRRDPAAMAAMRTPPAQSAPQPTLQPAPTDAPAFKDNKMFATGGFGSNARIPGVR